MSGLPPARLIAFPAAREVHNGLDSVRCGLLRSAVMLDDGCATAALAQNVLGNGTYLLDEVLSAGDLCEALWTLLDILYDLFHESADGTQQEPGELGPCDDGRWWRQSPVAAFGTTEPETQHLLHATSATAEQLVTQLAGVLNAWQL